MRIFQENDFLKKQTEIYQLVTDLELQKEENIGFPSFKFNVEGTNKNILIKAIAPPNINSIQLELQHFINAIINGIEPSVTVSDACHSLSVATKIMDKINSSMLVN